ncbi:sulfurtransferase complex subunit TusB [Vibrio amylolyticus]|uniref:sulfurtransferase complex subunit TusB n=1 Tax=Vibrio amylolyticus TaxID=2847292 RepID=UPI00354F06CA
MLYIVTKSENLSVVSTFVTHLDEVVLTQSSVYLCNPKHFQHPLLESMGCPIYVLSNDLQARGVESLSAQAISIIDMEKFVDLTAKHDKSVSW